MGNNLDKINFKKADPEGMIDHIEGFPRLCQEAWNNAYKFSLPSYFVKAKKFIVLGMGSSGIAGDLLAGLLYEKNIIFESIHEYKLPGWADKETLVIACSYSGNTEETLSAFVEAHNKGCKLLVISGGGKLRILAEKFKCPGIFFNHKSAARASFPYTFVSLLSVFVKLGYYEMKPSDFLSVVESLDRLIVRFKSSNGSSSNIAKSCAKKIIGKTPIVYGSGILKGVAQRFKTQINENAKQFAACEMFPETKHNGPEGLLYPKNAEIVLMLESNFSSDEITKGQNVLAEVLRRNKISLERIKFVPCEGEVSEILSVTMFVDFVSYYLAILNGVDPTPNHNIDYLKKELEK